ncbi:MAG: Hsp70 family protein [Verrucomicrobia bacterium]|nr:Hsp70 family protein [Verrucomicrobiota bacterium]
MSRTTIDYGIDLGTTNSAIAVIAGTGTEVIKNNVDADVTPSAVYINRSGNLWVGQNAKSKLGDERAEDDVFIEFKRRMGTGFEYAFRASGRHMKPEDLTAEVMKSLRSDVAQKKGEQITAAVLTVPAAFELHQCEATKRAAELAGFRTAQLVQEPVAAALAYGYQKVDAKAYWLVFDFGGGTFDAALIRSEDGSMAVANHGGDNFLGGSDIDWAIVEEVLLPRIRAEFKVPDFKRGTSSYKYDLMRLKAAAETAKVELSRKETTFLEATLRRVGSDTVTFETEITRNDVIRAAEPAVMKAVNIALRVLSEKGLSPSAVEKLIFVGGPTLAPYFRDLVKERMRIPCDLSMDPLTVVARGAAIFAGTQKIVTPKEAKPVATPGQYSIELIYKPVGSDPEPIVGGRTTAPAAAPLAGCTIEFVNQQTKWRSGKITLKENGAFQFNARAEKGIENIFRIELRDTKGTLCPTQPDQFKYTMGVVVEEQPIINNMGVALANNKMGVHFTKGQGLPAKHTRSYRTSLGLRKGETGSMIKIPIVEGNRELADRNVLIGSVDITADKIDRDLPAGSEIEVTLLMDASRLLTVLAYVPLLDEEFPAKIELGGKVRQPDVNILRQEWNREIARLTDLKAGIEQSRDIDSLEVLHALEASSLSKKLEEHFSGDGTDFDALLQTDRELLEFKVNLDDISARVAWPSAVKEVQVWLSDLAKLVAQHGTQDEKKRARVLREQIDAIIAEKNEDRLKKKMEEISDVYSSILYRQKTFWVEYFETLASSLPQMRDPEQAKPLIEQGRAHVTADKLEDLKTIVYQLQDQLPKKVVEQARRGYGSGLVT